MILDKDHHKEFRELESWIAEKQPKSQKDLDKAVERMNRQIAQFRNTIKNLSLQEEKIEQKLKVIQEAASHLSFHVGEIILLRRSLGQYPFPHQMQEFLHQ